jgi:hypothetical protein
LAALRLYEVQAKPDKMTPDDAIVLADRKSLVSPIHIQSKIERHISRRSAGIHEGS